MRQKEKRRRKRAAIPPPVPPRNPINSAECLLCWCEFDPIIHKRCPSCGGRELTREEYLRLVDLTE